MEDKHISIKNLSVAYHEKPVLWDITAHMPIGKLSAIIGPNGAGKSTLVKALLHLVPRVSGIVTFSGQAYNKIRHTISYIPQRQSVDWDFPISVQDLVAMGMYPELKWYRFLRIAEKRRIQSALEQVDLLSFANRQISQLSGGQQQRAFIARSLIQDVDIYFMDEPFASIDAFSEKAIFNVIDMLKQRHKTIVIVHHDLQKVKEYFDYVLMVNLRVIACGPVKKVFTDENLSKTYKGRLTLLENAANAYIQRDIHP